MSKLTVELVQSRLLEKDEMKKVSAQKLKLSKHRRPEEVKNIKDPSTKMTTIKQVEVPKEEGKKSDKGNSFIPQADFASKYTDQMPHGQGPGGGKDGKSKSQKSVSTTSMKPNQQTKLKQVKNTVKGTEDDGDQKAAALPTAKFASEYTDSMPHGSKTLGSGKESGGESDAIGKQSVAKMAGGPTRAGGARTAKSLGERPGTSRAKDVGKPSDNAPKTTDSMKPVKFKKDTGGSHNVVESGIAVKLGGKTKATFDIVNRKVLDKMVESYEKVGYEIVIERVQPSWKSDRVLIGLLRESVNAKYNFAPQSAVKLRKAALQRFHNITRRSYNSMYESRQDYVQTVKAAFSKIEDLAEGKYLDGLEIFECAARVNVEGVVADLEIVTEATDHEMALRQIRNQIAEEYGFDAEVRHIFVDGKKYMPSQIVEYTISEKWNTDYQTPESKKGMFKGKTKAELEKQLSNLKKSGPHAKGSPEYTKEKELNFAIRAKGNWK